MLNRMLTGNLRMSCVALCLSLSLPAVGSSANAAPYFITSPAWGGGCHASIPLVTDGGRDANMSFQKAKVEALPDYFFGLRPDGEKTTAVEQVSVRFDGNELLSGNVRIGPGGMFEMPWNALSRGVFAERAGSAKLLAIHFAGQGDTVTVDLDVYRQALAELDTCLVERS